jgi:hypothetical protein
MRKEVKIMSELYHPNIVLFMGACFRKGQMAMVTEIMPEVRSQSVRVVTIPALTIVAIVMIGLC